METLNLTTSDTHTQTLHFLTIDYKHNLSYKQTFLYTIIDGALTTNIV